MTTYYVDLALGNNANAGTSWALAKKSVEAGLGLTSASDVVKVAKGFEASLGTLTFTNGSNKVAVESASVITLLDELGDFYQNSLTTAVIEKNSLYPNTFKTVGNTVAFNTGTTVSSQAGTAVGSISFVSSSALPTVPSGSSFIVIRTVNEASATDRVKSININGALDGTGNAGIGSTTGLTSSINSSTTQTTRNVYLGSSLFAQDFEEIVGASNVVGTSHYTWYDVGTTLQNSQISRITLFASGAGSITGIWVVSNVPQPTYFKTFVSSLTANGGSRIYGAGTLNHVVGPINAAYPAIQVARWCTGNVTTGVRSSKMFAECTMNWPHATLSTAGKWATTFSYSADTKWVVPGGVTLIGGVNTATNVEDGVTRIACAADPYVAAPGSYEFSLVMKNNSQLRGFSSYNWKTGALLNMTTTSNMGAYSNVNRATTTNITLSGAQTVDGQTVSSGRILVKNQTTASENGIYVASAGAWSRATDLDTDAEAVVGKIVYVTSGSTNGDKYFEITSKTGTFGSTGSITFGTPIAWSNTTVNFDEVTSCGSYNAGVGAGINLIWTSSSCPTNIFVRYRAHGPNKYSSVWTGNTAGLKPEWSYRLVTGCTGWGDTQGEGAYYISATPKFAVSSSSSFTLSLLGGFVNFLMSSSQNSYASIGSFGYKRSGAFSTSSSSLTTATELSRNRGNALSITSISSVVPFLKKTVTRLFSSSSVSDTTGYFNTSRKMSSDMSVTNDASFTHQTDKGMPFGVTGNTGSAWSFGPIKQFPWVVSVVSAVSAALGRDRGYKFSSLNSLDVSPSLKAARSIDVSAPTSSSVVLDSLKHISEVAMDTLVVNSAVALQTLKFNKGVRFVSSVASSIAHSPAINRVVSAVSSATSDVSSAIGRSRVGQFAVSALGQVYGIDFSRLKSMAWNTAAALGVDVPLRKATSIAFVSTANAFSFFANNLLVSFSVSATTGVSTMFGRTRPVSTSSLSALTQAVFGAGVDRAQTFSTSSASTSSLSVLRNRGYVFTIPMSHSMTANLARLVGEKMATSMTPVISVVFGREYPSTFETISEVGTTLTVKNNLPLLFIVGEVVDVDGFIRVSRPVSEQFGSASGSSAAAGVRRGVQFTQSAESGVSNTAGRLVSLVFTLETGHMVGVSANGNRLDEYFVQFEDDKPFTLADGSIVLGSRRLHSTGIRQNQHPVFNISMPKPDVFEVTVVEDDK